MDFNELVGNTREAEEARLRHGEGVVRENVELQEQAAHLSGLILEQLKER